MEAISLDFTNRNVVITGGTGGIGRACAEGVIRGGGRAIILDLFPELGEHVCEELGGESKALFYKMDQSNTEEISKVLKKIISDVGQIHALINCAGIVSTKKFEDLPQNEWERVINIDLTGVFTCCQIAYQHMAQFHHGHIVNISSVAAVTGGGFLGTAAYVAAKAGVIGLSKAIAREGAEKGINCVAINPGGIWTNILDKLDEEILKKIKGSIPMGHFCSAQDCANVVLFYASDLASFVTGNVAYCDGGMTRA